MLNGVFYIESGRELSEAADYLSSQKIIGVDTESDSLYSYREKTCLIQISSHERDYVIDPLSCGTIECLRGIFSSKDIEKIFHAAEYDIICLRRDYGFDFSAVFDTMVASSILGRKKIGLADLVLEEFEVTLKKKHQKADWSRRPLTEDMIIYACMDTHYLIPLRNRLKEELGRKKLLDFANDDFETVCRSKAGARLSPVEIFWKMKGLKKLSRKHKAALWQLFLYREKASENRNRPPFKILSNSVLLDLAASMPENTFQLKKIKGMTSYNIKKHGKAILESIRISSGSEAPKAPEKQVYDPDFYILLDRLKAWRKEKASQMRVNSSVILPRELMMRIALNRPDGPEELRDLMSDSNARLKHFGEEIARICSSFPES
jgi:ribonuclease D